MSTFKPGKAILLPTDKAENALIINTNGGKMWNHRLGHLFTQDYIKSVPATSHHIYITSEDEIKDGDWWVKMTNDTIGNYKLDSINPNKGRYKKIIATTNPNLHITQQNGKLGQAIISVPQLSLQFIQHYITEYNKGNIITDVQVEYVDNGEEDWIGDDHNGEPFWNEKWEVRINPDNTVNIKPIKNNWTKDEVIELLVQCCSEISCEDGELLGKTPIELYNWLNKNVQ